MALINWNSSLSVDIVEIDKQHQKLVSIINELYEAMKLGKGKDILELIMTELVNYTAIHFKSEERYFDKFGYPDTVGHKKEHSEFVAKVMDFKTKFESGRIYISVEIMNFLKDWLQNHIKGTDKKYSPFFIEHGVR